MTGLMLNHILGVGVRKVHLKEEMWVSLEPHVRIGGVPYDFRFYSLVLLGVLGAWAGIRCVQSAWRQISGDSTAWRVAARASLALAAMVSPLLPLQEFAIPVLIMCGLTLTAAFFSRHFSRA